VRRGKTVSGMEKVSFIAALLAATVLS